MIITASCSVIGIDGTYLANGTYDHFRFDSIDYAEIKAMYYNQFFCLCCKPHTQAQTHKRTKKKWQWQVGSEAGNRYGHFGGANETSDNTWIHIVLVVFE